MKSKKRKVAVYTSIYIFSFLIVALCILVVGKGVNYYLEKNDKTKYVNEEVIEKIKPVINETKLETSIIKPFNNKKVNIGKYYYDYKDEENNQEKSIIYYNKTYMQNSGIDYINDDSFDVMTILDGEVLSIKNDKNLGNIVEIKHDKDIISIYQGIDNVIVKKGDVLKQGNTIGTSAKNDLYYKNKYLLHFEICYKGELINPEEFYSKSYEEL